MPFLCSLFVHNGPPTCLCVPDSVSISSWAFNHLSQLVLIMTTLTTCDDIMNNLSTFSQLVLIMIHIATDSCLLSLFSCRLHGWNYAIGYIIKRQQCNFCYHMHKYFMLVPTMAFLCWRFHTNNVRTVHGSPYTFSVKPKWRTVVFWFFAARSSAEAYLRTSLPRGHSTVRVSKRCEGFVAIWLRAREDIAANRFQLLFINIDNIICTLVLYIL